MHLIKQVKFEINCEDKDQGLYGNPLDCTKFNYCQTTFKAGQMTPVITRHDFVNISFFIRKKKLNPFMYFCK